MPWCRGTTEVQRYYRGAEVVQRYTGAQVHRCKDAEGRAENRSTGVD